MNQPHREHEGNVASSKKQNFIFFIASTPVEPQNSAEIRLIESTREMQRLLELQRLRDSPHTPTYCDISLSPVFNSPQRHNFSKVLAKGILAVEQAILYK
jgi:hypothetical protein